MKYVTITVLALVVASLGDAAAGSSLAEFDLTGLDGQIVNTRTFSSDPKWLILYVQGNCRPCDNALQLVKNPERSPNIARRLVIIGGGMSVPELIRLKDRYPDLAAARWYVAPAQSTRSFLNISGVPVVLGMDHKLVLWTKGGIPADPSELRIAMEAWTR